jgi:hypothetical protein
MFSIFQQINLDDCFQIIKTFCLLPSIHDIMKQSAPPGKGCASLHLQDPLHVCLYILSKKNKRERERERAREREREREGELLQLKSEKLIQPVIDKSKGYEENLTHLNKSLLKVKKVVSVGS